jgi:hypothetical protein
MNALAKLRTANIRVYHSEHPTVEETVAAFQSGTLREVSPENACAHHGPGHHDPGPVGLREGGPHGSCQH